MARTAPVPNIPPIPGMCPGVVVAGGGGDGGGGSAGAGKGGKGKKGAGAKKGKNDPKGDKKNANDNKDGKGKKGDPVDVVTGFVDTQVQDFAFPGPMEFRFRRRYASQNSHRDLGLGHGWSFEYGWRIEADRRRLVVFDDEGSAHPHSIALAKTTGSIDDLGNVLTQEGDRYVLRAPDGDLVRTFAQTVGGARFALVEVRDRNGNSIAMRHDDRGVLRRIVDSAGRELEVDTDGSGRIVSVRTWPADEKRWVQLVRFVYDQNGDLVEAFDPLGHSRKYRYSHHLLVEHVTKNGLHYHWRFDGTAPTSRAIETWGEYPGRVDAAVEDLITPRPAVGPDRRRLKGIFHYRFHYYPNHYTEVEGPYGTSRHYGNEHGLVWKEVKENGGVTTREFDGDGHLLGETNANGATIRYVRDERGRALATTDPFGRTIEFEYDSRGAIVRRTDQDGTQWRYERDPQGNVVSFTRPDGRSEIYVYDHRGLTTEFIDRAGECWRYDHDQHANLIREHAPDGVSVVLVYDWLGRIVEHHDGNGRVTRAAYNDRGDLLQIVHPDGAVDYREYDAEGNLTRREEPGGRVHVLEYGGHDWLAGHTDPLGRKSRYSYDSLGNVVGTVNASGERFHITRNAARDPVGFLEFDGTISSHEYDALGNRKRTIRGGRVSAWEYDGLARPVVAAIGDTEVTYEWDAVGHFVGSSLGAVQRKYDAAGFVVEDATESGSVKYARDPLGRITRVETSEGAAIEYDWSPRGHLLGFRIQGVKARCELDGEGRLTRLDFGDCVHVENSHDPTGRLIAQTIENSRTKASLVSRQYRYDGARDTTEVRDAHWGVTTLERDAASQVRRAVHADPSGTPLLVEDFAYTSLGLPQAIDAGRTRVVAGRGGQVASRDGLPYLYDDAGRLVEIPGDDGPVTLAWSADDLLIETEASGHRAVNRYDSHGRRLRQTTFDANGVVVDETRFLWADEMLVQEISTTRGTTVYAVHLQTFEPLAMHRDGVAYLFVADASSATREAISAAGEVAWRGRYKLYGELLAVDDAKVRQPFRFLGQFADDDTGLVFNRYRFYDPRTGTFASQDPVGLNGGLNPYLYTSNPTDVVDPLGLAVQKSKSPWDSSKETWGEYTSRIGEHAGAGNATGKGGYIPNYPSANQKFPESIHNRIDALGAKHGCHTCKKKPGDSGFQPAGPKHNFTPDHQPPGSLKKGGKFRLYPQCGGCSDASGGSISHQSRKNLTRPGFKS